MEKKINWTCLNSNEQENIRETIYMENDKFERLNENDVKKIYRICKYFEKFNALIKNNKFNEDQKVKNFLKIYKEDLDTL